jgi:hypothetical protein
MAYEFTAASSQAMTIGSAPVTTVPFTMACWFKPTTYNSRECMVFLGANTNAGHLFQLAIRSSTDSPANEFVAGQFATSGYNQSVAGVPTNDQFSHGAGVFVTNSERLAYLNGVAGTLNTGNSGTPTSINRVCIGAVGRDTRVEFANSVIAEVGIWNAALTAAEIASLAKGMTCDKVRPQSLVFYAPLVRDLIDYKGGLTITNNNTATVANHPRVYA